MTNGFHGDESACNKTNETHPSAKFNERALCGSGGPTDRPDEGRGTAHVHPAAGERPTETKSTQP